ncbi:MAG: ribonuclease H-like domain-containing protein [Deltaproteobacteria bacterium]|nr:ribonuclease H-like domain-containing protein [Deltaproteobacteria bacterium]
MLKNTFCHIQGLGLRSERRLWSRGVLSWDAFLDGADEPHARPNMPASKAQVLESIKRLEAGEPSFFARSLPAGECWRLFAEFRSSTAYLDIETNGYAGPSGYITAITLYDGVKVYNYVKGRNLNDFKRDIRRYKVVVTYNGRCFDVPFIERDFRIRMPHAHIDLRYILKDLGFTGGLKGCEKQLGIDRKELNGVDGYFAVLLWQDFKRNRNEKSLATLLAYNVQDVVNLEPLMVAAYNMKLKATPFRSSHALSPSACPELPFKADTDTINRILHENQRFYPQLSPRP